MQSVCFSFISWTHLLNTIIYSLYFSSNTYRVVVNGHGTHDGDAYRVVQIIKVCNVLPGRKLIQFSQGNRLSLLDRGSNMSIHVLLNILNDLRKKIRCEALPSIVSISHNEFNTFSNTGARMKDSIYSMTLQTRLNRDFRIKTLRFYR